MPGELKGYWEAKQKYGNPNVTWASLIEPSIKMSREGIYTSFSQAKVLKDEGKKAIMYKDPGMR